jgi:DUF1680 family protein
MKTIAKLLSVMLFLCFGLSNAQTAKKDYQFKPVPFTQVKFNDNFWAPKLKINKEVTIPIIMKKNEETGRVNNFKVAGGLMKGKFATEYPFDDTDIYKVIEAASYSLQVSPDPKLDAQLDTLISYVAAAQEKDGYLYTTRTIDPAHPHEWAGKERWEKEEDLSHELYNAGHMYEAAVAHYAATGKKTFLNIAIKNADLIDKVFGWGKLERVPGHEIIEMGLVKLYRVTNEERYLTLAKFFIDKRGKGENQKYGDYAQMQKPFTEQTEAVGHAVRAGYLYSGAADVAALTGDKAYQHALNKIWEDVVYKKLYITGGTGAQGNNEGFADPYNLPNSSAYCETCASISDVFWNHRMFLLEGNSKYYDVLERTLYNGVISGVSVKGDRFFYSNPLASFGSTARSEWFQCACCPPNLARFLPSLPGYVYATKGNDVYVNLFVQSDAKFEVNKSKLGIKQKTNYPWNGKVVITVSPEKPSEYDFYIRIPGWSVADAVPGSLYEFVNKDKEKLRILVNGTAVQYEMRNGYAVISKTWNKGDNISFTLDMPVEKVIANSKVEADREKVALQRGPIVYCAEAADFQSKNVFNIIIDKDAKLSSEFREDLLNGVQVITGETKALALDKEGKKQIIKEKFTAVPYYAWNNRGLGQMAVWLASDAKAATPIQPPTIASTSKVSGSIKARSLSAINDLYEPANSNDHTYPYFHWWPKKGSAEYVQYDFANEQEVSLVKVYWFDDEAGQGGCRVPASWRVLYKEGDNWIPVKTKEEYKVEKDKYNEVKFEKVKTGALRLEVQLQKEWAAGIHEWIVK